MRQSTRLSEHARILNDDDVRLLVREDEGTNGRGKRAQLAQRRESLLGALLVLLAPSISYRGSGVVPPVLLMLRSASAPAPALPLLLPAQSARRPVRTARTIARQPSRPPSGRGRTAALRPQQESANLCAPAAAPELSERTWLASLWAVMLQLPTHSHWFRCVLK
jgi:hypothetical protein